MAIGEEFLKKRKYINEFLENGEDIFLT